MHHSADHLRPVAVCGRHEVRKYVKNFGATALLTLNDGNQSMPTPPRVDKTRHSRVAMNDTLDQNDLYAPSLDHVRRIDAFLRNLPADARLLVHCEAGVSRSAAAALAVLALGRPLDALPGLLMAMRPQANPNRLLLKHFDGYYGWNGALLATADSFPRRAVAPSPDFL